MKRLGYVYPISALALVLSLSTGLSALAAETPDPASEDTRMTLLLKPEKSSDCTKSCGVDPNG